MKKQYQTKFSTFEIRKKKKTRKLRGTLKNARSCKFWNMRSFLLVLQVLQEECLNLTTDFLHLVRLVRWARFLVNFARRRTISIIGGLGKKEKSKMVDEFFSDSIKTELPLTGDCEMKRINDRCWTVSQLKYCLSRRVRVCTLLLLVFWKFDSGYNEKCLVSIPTRNKHRISTDFAAFLIWVSRENWSQDRSKTFFDFPDARVRRANAK